MKSGTPSLIMVIICFIVVKEKKKYENLKKEKNCKTTYRTLVK